MSDENSAEGTTGLTDAEAAKLNEALAKEMGFEKHETIQVTEEADSWLREFEKSDPINEDSQTGEEPVEVKPPELEQKWEYTHPETGKVHKFDNEADKLRFQIGADANKWKARFDELEAKVNKGEQPAQTQPNQPVDPKTLLFDEPVLKNEEWAPIVDVMTKMMEKYHALSVQDQDARLKGLTEQYEALKGQLGESAVRSEYGISRSDEAEILEQQPRAVQEGLANLDPAARLAVIRQLKGKSEAPVEGKPPLPRAVPPQQAHVESSARGEPDADRTEALFDRFDKMSSKDQLSVLGRAWGEISD